MHASISDLTTFSRDASGDIPRPLIGASTTVVGDKVYLFGGKSNTARKNYTSDVFAFDLITSVWEKIDPTSPEQLSPVPRYFHSTDYWQGYLVVFGGIGIVPSQGQDTQSVLADVRFFSLKERRWLDQSVSSPSPQSVDPSSSEQSMSLTPRPRFAHLSTIASSKLFILGGQDMVNEWLDDIHVFDLVAKQWIAHVQYPRNCGTYRSAVVAPDLVVRDPISEGVSSIRPESVFANVRKPHQASPSLDSSSIMAPHPLQANSDKLVLMPYSADPTQEHPAHLYIYSNWNFVDVRRELETIDPTPNTPSIINRSASMTSNASIQPPGLRFPTAHILGTHLIIGGTYLAQSYQSYSIWALDLQTMVWSRVDPGTALTTGSWSRGVLWSSKNRFVVFGNRRGNLVEDYNRRVVNWDHVAYVELESLGIYQPPVSKLASEIPSGNLLAGTGHLMGLDALDAEVFADFEVLCEDGRRIKCSRKLLEERWEWFRTERIKYVEAAQRIVASQQRSELETDVHPPSQSPELGIPLEDRPDPRLTPRLLRLSEPYPIAKALLQYFYTYDLITPLQHAPLVLSALLLLSAIYKVPHLGELVRHAMHRSLGPMTSVGVYDVTTLCNCQNLNIRALRVVMSSNKRPAARSARTNINGSGPGGPGRGRSPGPPTNDYSSGGGGSGRDNGSMVSNNTSSISDSRSTSRLGGALGGRSRIVSENIPFSSDDHRVSTLRDRAGSSARPLTVFKDGSPAGSFNESSPDVSPTAGSHSDTHTLQLIPSSIAPDTIPDSSPPSDTVVLQGEHAGTLPLDSPQLQTPDAVEVPGVSTKSPSDSESEGDRVTRGRNADRFDLEALTRTSEDSSVTTLHQGNFREGSATPTLRDDGSERVVPVFKAQEVSHSASPPWTSPSSSHSREHSPSGTHPETLTRGIAPPSWSRTNLRPTLPSLSASTSSLSSARMGFGRQSRRDPSSASSSHSHSPGAPITPSATTPGPTPPPKDDTITFTRSFPVVVPPNSFVSSPAITLPSFGFARKRSGFLTPDGTTNPSPAPTSYRRPSTSPSAKGNRRRSISDAGRPLRRPKTSESLTSDSSATTSVETPSDVAHLASFVSADNTNDYLTSGVQIRRARRLSQEIYISGPQSDNPRPRRGPVASSDEGTTFPISGGAENSKKGAWHRFFAASESKGAVHPSASLREKPKRLGIFSSNTHTGGPPAGQSSADMLYSLTGV